MAISRIVLTGDLSAALTRAARRLDVTTPHLVRVLHAEGALQEAPEDAAVRRAAADALRRRAGVIGRSDHVSHELLQIADQLTQGAA